MTISAVTLEQLLRLLPEQEELEELRKALFRAGTPDPGAAWGRSGALATADRRLVEPGPLESAIDEAEHAYHAHGRALFGAYRTLMRAQLAGRHADVARELVALADRKEASGLFAGARQYLEVALALAEPLPDKAVQVLVLQRLARVCRSAGEPIRAARLYARSGELAGDIGDVRGAALAKMGEGSTHALGGRWEKAESLHHLALELLERADAEYLLEMGQVYNNLGYFAARRDRLADAERWLGRAAAVWKEISSPADVGVYHHCRALVRKASGAPDEARAEYLTALDLPLPPAMRAGIAIDLAELCLEAGDREAAERWGRAAEDDAISSRSPYLLGRVYQVRGNVARDCGDDEGFVFYEKALEIARDRELPLLEGETLLDYSALRSRMGELDEARSFLERAREIFERAGASSERARLDGLPTIPPPVRDVPAGPPNG